MHCTYFRKNQAYHLFPTVPSGLMDTGFTVYTNI